MDIRRKCSANSNNREDTFVGLKCDNGDIQINFPMGFHISEGGEELRKDILLLLETLAVYTNRKDSELPASSMKFHHVKFPLQSYLFLIRDFLARGYYREQEVTYGASKRGKINWNRTIKTQKPYIQDNESYYLDFITKKELTNENELITMIHEYCIYDSFDKLGWLFTRSMPKRPRIKRKDKVFRATIRNRLGTTFNDQNRQLFRNMLAILEYQGDEDSEKSYLFGTYRFEYIWEKMIDKVFGIENKSDYFPKTMWKINGSSYGRASLEPDTIMVYKNKVYVLDAKYYKYGISGRTKDLPGSASVHKQITYGEYAAGQDPFRRVYNAFLMPFDSLCGSCSPGEEMVHIGEAVSNWKDNAEDYQRIQGILIDVKMLMQIHVRQEKSRMQKLAKLIEQED